jgi:L-alanine-DL-glutamate epimerase-like enolase superfamily enzyme
MKVTSVTMTVISHEVKNPVSDAMWTYDAGGNLITRIHTDEGITGYAHTYFGRIKKGAYILKTLIEDELAPAIIGQDPFFVRQARKKLWDAAHYHHVAGLAQFGIAALDIALWDIAGKKLNVPVAKAAGAFRDRIPAYAMVGWYYDDEAEFIKRCEEAVAEGFKALKIKVGRGSLQNDIERIELVRRAVGEDIILMVDANQIFDYSEAVRRGRRYEELGIYWFEEPMPPELTENHVRLAQTLDIPIAAGENHYTRFQFYEAIRQGAVDIIQPDNRRAGGFTEWLEIGAVSDCAGLKIASHGGGSANVNMLCVLPNAIYLESGSLKGENKMLKTQLQMIDGEILLPDVPGMGHDADEEYVEYLVKNQ